MLGKRNNDIYGAMSLFELENQLKDYGEQHNFEVVCYQTNSEAACIDYLHTLYDKKGVALIINAGAWTHYNYAIRDALEILQCPKVEVHLSDVNNREQFRKYSVIRDVVEEHFEGEHIKSYKKAIDYIKGVL